jgi:hypothetical protein
MPGFTAEASLYRTSGHYYIAGDLEPPRGGGAVLPQQGGDPSACDDSCYHYIQEGDVPGYQTCFLECLTGFPGSFGTGRPHGGGEPRIYCGPCNKRGM